MNIVSGTENPGKWASQYPVRSGFIARSAGGGGVTSGSGAGPPSFVLFGAGARQTRIGYGSPFLSVR